MVWLPRNVKKCIFFTPFSPFLAKKFFYSKVRLHHFFGTIKSYLDTKNQKKLWGRSSGIYSDGRKYECKSIVPPKFLGRSKNQWQQLGKVMLGQRAQQEASLTGLAHLCRMDCSDFEQPGCRKLSLAKKHSQWLNSAFS